jgi:replicative DNA helicase
MNDNTVIRTAPFSREAESSLLGALLLDNEAIHRIPAIEANAFYVESNAAVFRAIQQLATAGKPFDVVSVSEHLVESQVIEPDQGLTQLNELAQYVPSARNIRRYAEIVMERYRQRELMRVGTEISELAMTPGAPDEQLNQAQMLLAKLANVKARREPQHITDSLTGYIDLLTDLSEGKNPAIPTGIAGLDRQLNGGSRRGEVMVIGARPKHGKTALALALARNMAHDFNVLFLSQEMPISQLMHRHTAAMGSVDLGRILRADAADAGMWERVSDAAEKLGRLRLVQDDQSSLTLMDVRRKALKVRRERGLDVLFVDFLQLMQGANGGEDNRNRELDVIVNGLKGLAMDMQIVVVLLSQMSRKADEFYARPAMTHLRDSGAIEAAADQVILLFNDWAHPLSKKEPQFQGYAALEIVAHRNGPTGLVPLNINGALQQVVDWTQPIPSSTSTTKYASRGFSA